jgi:tetratricopeptide (TPR) repeat protein
MIEKFRIKTFWTVVLMLVLSVGIYGDTWYNNYEKAKDAIKEKNWSAAIKYLEEALKDRDKPEDKARTYGVRFVVYLPYYYLGKAYYGSKQYKKAREAFERSLDYGAVKKEPKSKNSLQRMLADCKEKLKPPPTEPKTTTETPETGEKEEKKEEETAEPEKKKEPAPKEEKSKIETQPPDLPKTEPGKKQEAPGKEKEAVPEDTRLTQGIKDLNQGIRCYFRGDRSESVRYLKEAIQVFAGESKHNKALVTAYQFLAVVLIENHYLSEDASGQLLQQARQYINEIRKLEPDFQLEENFFSPKVVKIFSR